jgi:ABC-type antimicrobial peptide transport system permease subunit
MAVQNTYISTFQTLGALGLLLGTFGLAAVQMRSVLERRQELGLMRAVGFGRDKLSWMVLMENAWLLFIGMSVGIAAALFTTVPHWFVGTASVPWLALAAMFAGIVAVGLIAGWFASRILWKMPLLDSLRA